MRMRYRDRADPAARVYFCDCSIVQQRDAIPEQISRWRLQEQRSLADGKFGFGANAEKSVRFFFETVSMIGCETFQCGPFLPAMVNKLPFVLTNRAAKRRLGGLGKLRSALHADEILHLGYGEPVISSEVERSLISWGGDMDIQRLIRSSPESLAATLGLQPSVSLSSRSIP